MKRVLGMGWIPALALIAVFGFSMEWEEAIAGEHAASEFRYENDAQQVILAYSQYSTLPYNGEPALGLEIHGDGKAIATLPEHFPQGYLKKHGYTISRRGYFETRLTPQEIEEILRDAEPSFLIDADAMKEKRKRQHPGRASTDGATTRLQVHLADYRPASGDWQGPVAQAIRWKNVYGDSRLYPGVAEIQALGKADRALSKWVFRIAERVEGREAKP